jgi:hypothetical protein
MTQPLQLPLPATTQPPQPTLPSATTQLVQSGLA